MKRAMLMKEAIESSSGRRAREQASVFEADTFFRIWIRPRDFPMRQLYTLLKRLVLWTLMFEDAADTRQMPPRSSESTEARRECLPKHRILLELSRERVASSRKTLMG